MQTSRNPVKDMVIAFGVVSAVVTIWQMLEAERAKKHSVNDHNAILSALVRIEKKLK